MALSPCSGLLHEHPLHARLSGTNPVRLYLSEGAIEQPDLARGPEELREVLRRKRFA